MSELYKYKCPSCNFTKEEKSCATYYAHDPYALHGTIFNEYICKLCGSSVMLTASMLKDDIACSNCGGLNTMELCNSNCPTCGIPMKKQFCIPTYPQVKIVPLNNEYYYIDTVGGKQYTVKKHEIINQYLSKISIILNDTEYWGLIDSNNILVLPCIYLSIQINEYGNVSVIYPRPTYIPHYYNPTELILRFDVDLFGTPIHRYYDENKECVRIDKFPEYEAVGKWSYDGIAICVKNDKEGLVYKDGSPIIDPIFDFIEQECGNVFYGHSDKKTIAILGGTYGEGVICVEECEREKNMQYFVDHHLNKVIVFNDEWAARNDIPFGVFRIRRNTKCHFENGYLEVDSAIDEYYGRKYKIDHYGDAEDIGDIYYKEFEYGYDLADVLNYDGYEECGYWGISDEAEREAFDDDPEARSSRD